MSTYKIKAFNPKSIKDVNKWRHENAVKEGYSRQDSAFRNMKTWTDRGKVFMLMPISSVGDKNKDVIIEELKLLQFKIERYLEINE